jgi:hypothetical protein
MMSLLHLQTLKLMPLLLLLQAYWKWMILHHHLHRLRSKQVLRIFLPQVNNYAHQNDNNGEQKSKTFERTVDLGTTCPDFKKMWS